MSQTLYYIVNARMPTEKAHGLHIAQMCEAYSKLGYKVTLVIPARRNPALRQHSIFEYYDVDPCFTVKRLWTLDLFGFVPKRLESLIFRLQMISFYFVTLLWLVGKTSGTVIYSRDYTFLWLFHGFYRNSTTVYDVHGFTRSKIGQKLLSRVVKRTTVTVAVTKYLAKDLEKLGNKSVLVAPNGIRPERFENMPDRDKARARVGLSQKAFVVCYVGRLQTYGINKGVDTLIDAFKYCYTSYPDWQGILLLVGGPQNIAEELRAYWRKFELPERAFCSVGQVPAADVPIYLAASDVCVSPLPANPHFSYHAAPIKLFEYIAAGRAIVTTNQPAMEDILIHEENAYIVPPSDPQSMGKALFLLSRDEELRSKLARQAKETSRNYTWQRRAKFISDAFRDASI